DRLSKIWDFNALKLNVKPIITPFPSSPRVLTEMLGFHGEKVEQQRLEGKRLVLLRNWAKLLSRAICLSWTVLTLQRESRICIEIAGILTNNGEAVAAVTIQNQSASENMPADGAVLNGWTCL
ncbi:hypothetical protein Golax_004329, partial [Gossypium laxum]|nr:hypothetical protein [Gossypium laxum]